MPDAKILRNFTYSKSGDNGDNNHDNSDNNHDKEH